MCSKAEKNIVYIAQPHGFFVGELYARGMEYLEAFEAISASRPDLRYAGYFLLSHSLELLLKSYLAAKGYKKRRLMREIGHNLDKAYILSERESLPHITNLKSLAFHMNEMGKDFDFRYPTIYKLSVPKPEECIAVVRELSRAISPVISTVAIDARLQFSSDTRSLVDEDGRRKRVKWLDEEP